MLASLLACKPVYLLALQLLLRSTVQPASGSGVLTAKDLSERVSERAIERTQVTAYTQLETQVERERKREEVRRQD